MLKNLISALAEAHTTIPKVAIAAPLLLLLPMLAEGAQHAVEWSIGMFSGPAGMRSAGASESRMAAGLVKVVALMVAGIMTARFWAYDQDLSRAIRLDRREWRFVVGTGLITAAGLTFVFMSGPLFDALRGTPFELPRKLRSVAPLLMLLSIALVSQKHSTWVVAGLLGDRHMSFERAKTLSSGRAAWFVVAVLILATTPAMVLHYALNFAAVGLSAPLQMLLLAIDSLLVGVMAILFGNTIWISYRETQKFSRVGKGLSVTTERF